MITSKEEKHFIRIYRRYFATVIQYSDIFRPVKYIFTPIFINSPFFLRKKIYTIHLDLTLSLDELLKAINHNFRKDIFYCIDNKIEHTINHDQKIFLSFYNEFVKLKGIKKAKSEFIELTEKNSLITSATYNNEILSMHYYLVDNEEKIVTCIYSATKRLLPGVNTSFIGKVNKFLHFKDIEFFKNQGMKIYDFGGYTIGNNTIRPNGINTFKERFGGRIVKLYNYYSFPYILMQSIIHLSAIQPFIKKLFVRNI
jgi:hypothetical protein